MASRRLIALVAVFALVASLGAPATAGKKKKAPKPYTSEEGRIAVPHTLLYASTAEVNSVTANEFEARCEIPASNGFDAYVYEVPAEYQKIQANFHAYGKASLGWDLYAFFYKEDCTLQPYAITASGTTSFSKQDAEGIMPAGTAYVLIADFLGDPATVYYELSPLK